MFINNNIIELGSIVIDVKKREIYIDNCDVITQIEIKFSKFVICSIYLRKTIIISSRTKMPLVVHYLDVSKDRDFLFKSKNNTSLIFYVKIINISTRAIIARINNNKLIQIFCNYCLDYDVEINYSNTFIVNANNYICNLVVRKLKFTYQNN